MVEPVIQPHQLEVIPYQTLRKIKQVRMSCVSLRNSDFRQDESYATFPQ